MNQDRQFRAEMAKLQIEADPLTGRGVASLVDKAMSVGAEVVRAIVQSTGL
jgi:hypothetical protein